VLSLVRSNSDSPDMSDPCLSHASEARPTWDGVGGDWSTSYTELFCCSGSCMLISPNRLVVKCRDPKANIESIEYLANA
jgi:hypothetical protein